MEVARKGQRDLDRNDKMGHSGFLFLEIKMLDKKREECIINPEVVRVNKHLSLKSEIAIFILAWGLLLFALPEYALAAFSLSATPRQGGQEMEFSPAVPGMGEVNQELDVSITTDIATQYELRQEPLAPLRNGKGEEISWNNLSVRGLRGTNQFGYLKTEPFKVINSILYTSNQNGTQDSFILVYTLNVPLETSPDFYRGQLRFSLTPIGSSQSTISLILNIIAEVKRQAGGESKPFIEITTATGGRMISLSSKKEDAKAFDVLVKINAGMGKPFRLKQFLPQPLQSTEGAQLDYEAVRVQLREVDKGTALPAAALSVSPQLIYTSEPDGTADDSFVVSYSLGDLSGQKAGRYKSHIQYTLDLQGVETRLEGLDIEIENERVFDLIFKSGDNENRDRLEFRDLKPEELFRINEATIEIKTNLGRQYQVSQNVLSDLTRLEGESIPGQNFTLRTESLDTKGRLKVPNKTEVKKGEMVLLVSDNQGSSDKFKIIYELVYPKDIKAGTYSTRLTYSLSEI